MKYFVIIIMFLPSVVFGASNLQEIIISAHTIVNSVLPIVLGVAILVFLWGLAKFIFKSGNEDEKTGGKNLMIYGSIAIFVMVSIFGIVNFLQDALGVPRIHEGIYERDAVPTNDPFRIDQA